MAAAHPNSFKARKTMEVGGKSYTYFSLKAVEKEIGDLSRLPFTLRILMENLVRHEDGTTVKKADIAAFADWLKNGGKSTKEINFRCARADAGLHRRASRGRPRRHARRHGQAGWRRQEDQSAGAGRSRHRPFRHRRRKRQLGLRRQRQARYGATSSATSSCGGPDGVRQFRVVPPGTGICHR
jgi:hypothetical protein